MKKIILFVIFSTILVFPSLTYADGPYLNIPPTNAFDKIRSDNGSINAVNFSMPLKIKGGTNISVTSSNKTHTVIITNTAVSSTNQGTYNKTLANNAVINSGGNRQNYLNGTNNPVRVVNDPTRNQVNITISSTGSGGSNSGIVINGLNRTTFTSVANLTSAETWTGLQNFTAHTMALVDIYTKLNNKAIVLGTNFNTADMQLKFDASSTLNTFPDDIQISASGPDTNGYITLFGQGVTGPVGKARVWIADASDHTKRIGFNLFGMTTNSRLMVNANQTTNQTVNIPNIKSTDTFDVLGLDQVFTGKKNFTNTSSKIGINLGTVGSYATSPRQGDLEIVGSHIQFQDNTNTTQIVSSGKSIIGGSLINQVMFQTTSINYLSLAGGSTNNVENRGFSVIPFAGTVKNCYTYIVTNSNTLVGTLVLRDNGVNQTITMSVPATTTGIMSDTTHSVTVAAGDYLTWFASKAATGATNHDGIMCEYDPS